MSHVRRVGGRFSTNAASETHQRQLVAPVNRWKKAWIVPAGLPAENSYKVCKWVRIIEQNGKESNHGSDSEGEGDEGTPGPADTEMKEETGDETVANGVLEPTSTGTGTPQLESMPGQAQQELTTTEPAPVEVSAESQTVSMDVDEPLLSPVEQETLPEVTTTEAEPAPPGAEATQEPAPAAELLQVEPTRSTRSRTRSKSPHSASPASLPPAASHIPSNAVEVSMAAPAGHGGVPGPGGISLLAPEVGESNEAAVREPEVRVVASEIVASDAVVETVAEVEVPTEAPQEPMVESEVPVATETSVDAAEPESQADEPMPERDEGVVMGVDDVPMLKGDDVAPEEVE